ncbi:MAG: S8 family serine peptidase, partial [Elusimicrobiota bacterium]
PSWKSDAKYHARALDWVIAQNKQLPAGKKIRVVSVSSAPSGPGSPVKKNNKKWDAAFARAEKAGLLVLDCEDNRGFIGPCTYDPADPENPAKCKKGLPNLPSYDGPYQLQAPASGRTVAEDTEYVRFSYSYWGQGGRSWSVPYVAGVAALGWQADPELTAAQVKDLLLRSATGGNGGVIDPPAFIELVRRGAAQRAAGRAAESAKQ